MKNTKLSLVLLIAATMLCLPARAQFGGLGKLVAPVTADSLLGEVNSGMDFFKKATEKYNEALVKSGIVLKEDSAAKAAANVTEGDVGSTGQLASTVKATADGANEMIAKGQEPSEEAKKLISEGNGEMAKGIAKWAVLSVLIAKASKDGASDAKLAAAILSAGLIVKELPEVKKMYDTMQKINKIKKQTEASKSP
jgi:hypothetical protein